LTELVTGVDDISMPLVILTGFITAGDSSPLANVAEAATVCAINPGNVAVRLLYLPVQDMFAIFWW